MDFQQLIIDTLIRALALVIAFPIHESAHAWVAYKLGDPTAKNLGRVSLNPFVHLDLFGTILIFLVGFGWGKPVPINPVNFKGNMRKGVILSSLAGPASNIVLAFIFLIILKICVYCGLAGIGITVLTYLVLINLGLAVFNLLPIPPLDGACFLEVFLKESTLRKIYQNSFLIFFIIFALIRVGPLRWLLSFCQNLLYNALDFLTGFVDLIFSWIG